MEQINTFLRVEQKYKLTQQQYEILKQKISSYVNQDFYFYIRNIY